MKISLVRLLSMISGIFIIAIVAVSCKPLVGPVYSKKETITAEDGKEFTVVFSEENVPDTEITITISENDQLIAEDGSFDAYLNDYDYQNDFVDRWYQVKGEHHDDSVDCYQFHWGILYTVNNGITYEMVPKHDYEARSEDDEFFRMLLTQIK